MGLLELFFLPLTLFFSVVHSENKCPSYSCGNNTFQIQYPFKIYGQQPQNCDYTNVICNRTQDIAVLDLTFYGDFYIRFIDYHSATLELHDPNNCLPGKLMNLNLQDSPFVIKDYQNFTFYNCPPEAVKSNLTAIDCLSNSTNAVVATSSISSQIMEVFYGCGAISTSQVPVSWFDSHHKLALTWNVPVCNDCLKEKGGWKQVIAKFLEIVSWIIFIATLLIYSLWQFCCCIQTFDNFRREGTVTNQSTISQATIFNTETSPNIGLDHSILNSCSELVVLDINEDQILGLGENICCSICLEGYKAKEKVRRINLCHHCFHADCVDRWLRENSTCPICRVSILDVKL